MDVETRPHPAVTSLEACPSTLARLIEELETHESLEDCFERVWRHGALCDVVWRHVMLCDILCCCVTLCNVVWRHLMLYDVIWCCVTLCDVVWCDVVWRRVTKPSVENWRPMIHRKRISIGAKFSPIFLQVTDDGESHQSFSLAQFNDALVNLLVLLVLGYLLYLFHLWI